jgi:drug/metabolite transporter superfamily protein YnfA
MRRGILSVAGIVMLAFGGLFLLQGMGVIRWPADSFMIDSRVWILRGSGIAVAGALLLILAQRRRRRS